MAQLARLEADNSLRTDIVGELAAGVREADSEDMDSPAEPGPGWAGAAAFPRCQAAPKGSGFGVAHSVVPM